MAMTASANLQGRHGGQKSLFSEAKRRAEQLFESSTVAEIREIESKTRADIEAKKNQLRQLVGDSYRDLIDSADKIVGMASNCEGILQQVKDIQHGFSSLAHSFTTADSILNEKRESLTRHEELYAVGGRVRYLVDTPEVIWGFLDSQQHLSAAQRFLRSQLVHQQLHSKSSRAMLAKFPLLSHQWPVVLKFRQQISSAVTASLSSGALSLDRTADALAALAALDGLDGTAALQHLLTARRAAFRQRLQSSSPATGAPDQSTQQNGSTAQANEQSGQSMEDVSAALKEAAAIIQNTVGQVGVLFLSPAASGVVAVANGGNGGGGTSGGGAAGAAADPGSCYLQLLVREDEIDLSELIFGGSAALSAVAAAGGASQPGSAAAPELAEWHKHTRKQHEGFAALPSGVVERAVLSWVKEVAEDALQHGLSLLDTCTTARQLVDVETALRAAIATWRLADHDTPAAAAAPARKRAAVSGASGAAAAPIALPAAARDAAAKSAHTWDGVCEVVLGTNLSLWQEVFYPLFIARSKQIISAGFESVLAGVAPQVDALMRQAESQPPEPAGEVVSYRWPDETVAATLSNGLALGADGLGDSAQGQAGSHQSVSVPWSERVNAGSAGRRSRVDKHSTAYRSGVHRIRKQVDAQLQSVLQSALLLLTGDSTEGQLPSSRSGTLASQGSVPGLQTSGSGALLNTVQRKGSAGLGGARSAGGGKDAVRAAELEPFLQSRCVDMASRLSALFKERLDSVGPQADGAIAAEKALLVGRLCCALAWESRYLPVLLGAPDAWRAALASTAAPGTRAATAGAQRGAAGSARALAASSKLQAAVHQLRSIGALACRVWAQWAAKGLTSRLRSALLSDDTLTSNTTPLSWQETVVPATSSGEASLDVTSLDDVPMTDMRFALPACPSAPTQALLHRACLELRRAGDHTAPAEAIQVWEWELLGACLSVYSQLLGTSPHPTSHTHDPQGLPVSPMALRSAALSPQLSEKGVLQLLFDVRLVRDVLVGGRPLVRGGAGVAAVGGDALLDAQDAEALNAMGERRKAGVALEQQLQDRLDPIDWATYEHHLWANVSRHSQRCLILYGALTQLRKGTQADAAAQARPSATTLPAAAGAAAALNPLGVLPVAPRFPYLPIAVPAPTSLASHQHHMALSGARGGANGALLNKGQQPGRSYGDLAAAYSFADLGVGGRASDANSAAAAASAVSAASAAVGGVGALGASATHAFGQLQARFGTGSAALGTLGSLLGDKAAEVTAMAQQRFDLGNLSDLSNAFGSNLLSFTKGVTTKK